MHKGSLPSRCLVYQHVALTFPNKFVTQMGLREALREFCRLCILEHLCVGTGAVVLSRHVLLTKVLEKAWAQLVVV